MLDLTSNITKSKPCYLTAIIPAGLVQCCGRGSRLWILIRSIDHPENGEWGCGKVFISMNRLCQLLQRSERSIWRYVKAAVAGGWLRTYSYSSGEFCFEYASLRSLCKKFGVKRLGDVGHVALTEVVNAKAHAASIAAEVIQAHSDYQRHKEWKKYAKGAKKAGELLAIKSPSAGVPGGDFIARGERLIYLAPHWRSFGASQRAIAKQLGCSVRTVQNRLCNAWREERGIPQIEKAQTAQQVCEDVPKDFLKQMLGMLEPEEFNRHVWLGRRLFKVGCNLYDTGVRLRRNRFQKGLYLATEEGEESRKAFLDGGRWIRVTTPNGERITIRATKKRRALCSTGGGRGNLIDFSGSEFRD